MRRADWPATLVFLLQRLLLVVAAAATGFDPFKAATWTRWDSGHYLEIANHGYTPLVHCAPETHYPASAWCGTAGWFPGYPLLLRALGGSPVAALLLGAACQWACLVLIGRLLGRRHWPALLLAAFFPGNVYLAAVFPTAVVALAIVSCLALCLAGRPGGAAVAALVAAACSPVGVLLAPVVAAWALLHRRFRALLVSAGALLGYAAAVAFLHQQVGRWDAYYLVQAKYGYRLGLPFDSLFARLKPIVNRRYRSFLTFTTGLQTLLSLVLVGAALLLEPRLAREAGPDGSGAGRERASLVLLCVAAFWLAPLLLGGSLSLYRSEALLLPAALLVPAFPRPLQWALAFAAIALSAPMAVLFLRGSLV